MLPEENILKEKDAQLKKYDIDYYFVWKKNAIQDSLTKNYSLAFYDENTNLRIYKLKTAQPTAPH